MNDRDVFPLLGSSRRRILGALLLTATLFSSIPSSGAEEVFFYHNDAVGSPVAMTDASGAVVWEADYLPFGEEWNLAEMEPNAHRFTGKERDLETGLHYFGARYYDASLGRFVSVDPILIGSRPPSALTIPQRNNLYAYSTNNPYRYVDPDGRYVETAFDIVSLGTSISEFASNPSLGNAISVVLDSISLATPLPAIGGHITRVGKVAKEGKKVTKAAKGAHGGKRAGKDHTKAAKRISREQNREQNDGELICPDCNHKMAEPEQRVKGKKVNPHEANADHIHPKSKGGDGATVKDMRNVKARCFTCNNKKSDKLP